MEPWQEDLIQTVVSSNAFPSDNRELHRQILKHLARHSSPSDRDLRKSDYLRDHFFHKNYKGAVGMFLSRLEHSLDQYFESVEGRTSFNRIELLRGYGVPPEERYSLRFPVNKSALSRIFWRPYLSERFETFIAYGVPLFIRGADQKKFTRYADVNVRSAVKSEHRDQPSDQVCWPFVAHGDLLAVFNIYRWLREQGVRVDYADFTAGDVLGSLSRATEDDAGVIALGSTRVNGILKGYQKLPLRLRKGSRRHLPFRVRLYDVLEYDEEDQHIDTHVEEHDRIESSIPVVITRRRGVKRNIATLIASNHGRAVQRTAEILTNEDELQELFEDERLQTWLPKLPTHFQILLRVSVSTQEDVGGAFTVEKTWSGE